MTVKVIDASVAAAILFVENEADMAMSMIDDADLVAPRLLPFELANVAVTKIRRHPEDRRKIVEGLNRFKAMGIRLQEAPETEARSQRLLCQGEEEQGEKRGDARGVVIS